MAYGKPVVSVNDTAVPGVVQDSGLLVPPRDPEAMAAAIVTLLENESMRREMGQRGRNRARALFDWDIVAGKYEAVLEDAVLHRKTEPPV